MSVFVFAFGLCVLATSGGKWLSVAASVVPLPCGFYSERMVEGAASRERACCRDTSWTERECWKREISRTFLFCCGEEQVFLPRPVYLLCPSLPGELFDAELIRRLQSPYQLHAYLCLFLFWSSLPHFAITHRVLGVAPAVPQWRIFIQHLSLPVTPINVTPALSSSIRYTVQTLVKPWLAVRKATRPTGTYHGIFKSRCHVLTRQVWFGEMVGKGTAYGTALGLRGLP